MLSGSSLLWVFLFTMAVLLFLLIKQKFSALVGLIIASILLGVLSKMPLAGVADGIATGFGNTMKSLGLVIALGGIFGLFLTESGGTEELAKAMLRKFGPKYDLLAINLTGFIISIPVFLGSAYIMLAPLVNSLSRLTRKKISGYTTSLFVGLIITHSLVPPTPGPVAVSGLVGSNIGFIILYGSLVGIVASLLCGWLLGNWMGKNVGFVYDEDEESGQLAAADEKNLLTRDPNSPSASLVVGLILFPAVLIMLGALAPLVLPENAFRSLLVFIGNGTVALFIAMLMAAFLLKKYIKIRKPDRTMMQLVDQFSDKMGSVILIVGVGGCFGAVISGTGLADLLVQYFTSMNMPVLLLAFVLTLILRASVGSATVAMLTASNIVGVAAVSMGYSPVIVTLVICAGSVGLSIPTDGGFWIAASLNKLDMPTALKAISLPSTVAALVVFLLTLALNMFVGVLPGL